MRLFVISCLFSTAHAWGHYSSIGFKGYVHIQDLWKDAILDSNTERVSEDPLVMRLKQASGAELWSAFDGNN